MCLFSQPLAGARCVCVQWQKVGSGGFEDLESCCTTFHPPTSGMQHTMLHTTPQRNTAAYIYVRLGGHSGSYWS